jgi:hypothetical protein
VTLNAKRSVVCGGVAHRVRLSQEGEGTVVTVAVAVAVTTTVMIMKVTDRVEVVEAMLQGSLYRVNCDISGILRRVELA